MPTLMPSGKSHVLTTRCTLSHPLVNPPEDLELQPLEIDSIIYIAGGRRVEIPTHGGFDATVVEFAQPG